MAVDTTIASDKIIVFPATKRADAYQQSSRLITEESITRQYRQLYNGGNFVITDIPDGTVVGDNQEFEFLINGYYVKIKDLKTLLANMDSASSNIYAIINMANLNGFAQLDGGDVEGDYQGVTFDVSSGGDFSLNLLHFTKSGSTYTLDRINSRPTIDGGNEDGEQPSYTSFTFNSIATQASSGTFEYGTSKAVTYVTPTFTNGSDAITSTKIGTTSGGSNLYNGGSATSGTAITLTTPLSMNGETDTTVYCTLSDGTTTTTRSTAFKFPKYTYYGGFLASSSTKPTKNDLTGVATIPTNGVQITTSMLQNIFFVSPTPIPNATIQRQVDGQWTDSGLDGTIEETANFTTSTNKTLTYYYYHTGQTLMNTTARFRIISGLT